jgi:hypothetical protein
VIHFLTQDAPACYVASTSVRDAEVDGLRVLLDFDRKSYRVLDDVASAFWSVLVGEKDSAVALEEIARIYAISPAEAQIELNEFCQRCLSEGILTRATGAVSLIPSKGLSPPRALPGGKVSVLRAWLCLIATRRALVRDGFRRTYERYSLMRAGTDSASLDLALRAFVSAENAFFSRNAPDDCLVRSLSLYRFLCGAALPVQHVIGVLRSPFMAHAWVEQYGKPLLAQDAGSFTPLAVIDGRALI